MNLIKSRLSHRKEESTFNSNMSWPYIQGDMIDKNRLFHPHYHGLPELFNVLLESMVE